MEASSLKNHGFLQRHLGPSSRDQDEMLAQLSFSSVEELVASIVPEEILDSHSSLDSLPEGCEEAVALKEMQGIAKKNILRRSLIGLGYHGTSIPSVIRRHVLENPYWYTAYTPYQAEISQGRLEALFNFQTLVSELTGLPISNASLLDEATAAAEAMSLSFVFAKKANQKRFLIDKAVLPQTLSVLRTRAEPLGIKLEIFDPCDFEIDENVFGVFLQLPGLNGRIWDPSECISTSHRFDALVIAAIDPLLQVLFQPVGELGVDIAVGSMQRFGVPMGFGGPHAAFFATREAFKRQVPGRLVGQSLDADGEVALRLALQTREQHIRRDKATSNICTSQVLLAVISSFYAVHHGPEGLRSIALRIISFRSELEEFLTKIGYKLDSCIRFDTVEVHCKEAPKIHKLSELAGFNLRVIPLGASITESTGFGITFDELTTKEELILLQDILIQAGKKVTEPSTKMFIKVQQMLPGIPLRKKPWLQQDVFNLYRSETDLLRYMTRLVNKDFSLVHGMIPLGSCTMKLNAAAELIPISWQEFADIHPFAPLSQVEGYLKIFQDLEHWLSTITGFSAVSLQPNAGSQGEFAGLLVIRAWHKARDQEYRNVCLIPTSAHGTNPASCVMAGLRVVSIDCDKEGNIDFQDLEEKAKLHSDHLSALMITYPSTHGVFEPKIREICDLIHNFGGQVYLDGANLNAQVGLCRPGLYGADVCHINLHKTFCIPHGGGGPGVGPIAVAEHLAPYLPGHPLVSCGGQNPIGAVSAAPWGSAGILSISWMYLRMIGSKGLREASSIALLSANYIAHTLEPYYPVLFRGPNNLVAHECILDLRTIKRDTGIQVEDIAKRLMDYGFHAPTVSWPVAGTLMVEPTESEGLNEIKRFCDAMIAIKSEIDDIQKGESDPEENALKNAPHTLLAVTAESWEKPYSRKQAAFPLPEQLKYKFWPSVSRIDNAYGDRNLVCSCVSITEVTEQ